MHFAAKIAGILITPNYTADGKKNPAPVER